MNATIRSFSKSTLVLFLGLSLCAVIGCGGAASMSSQLPTTPDTSSNGVTLQGIAVNPSSSLVYATNEFTGQLAQAFQGVVINGSNNSVVSTLSGGTYSTGVGVDAARNLVYIANYDDGTVSVISTTDNSLVATIQVGSDPGSVAVNPITHAVYVSDNAGSGSYEIEVIDGITNTVTAKVNIGLSPSPIAVDSATNTIYAIDDSGLNSLVMVNGNTNTVSARVRSMRTPPRLLSIPPQT